MAESFLFTAGSSQYLEYASGSVGPHKTITGYPFTFTAWMRPVSSAILGAGVVFSDSTVSNINFSVGGFVIGSPNRFELFARNGSNNSISSTTDVVTGTWYSVVGVFNSATNRELFIDGVSQGTDTVSVTFPSTLDVTGVGRLGDSTPSAYLTSDIAYVRIFDYALTQSDIYSMILDPDSISSGLVWKLDLTNASTPGEDTSGNGWNATGTAPAASTQTPPNIKNISGCMNFYQPDSNRFLIPSGNSGPHDNITNAVTFAAWIKSTGTQTGTVIGIIGLGTSLFNMSINSTGEVRYYINGTDINGVTNVVTGQWVHIACTTSSGKNSHVIYVNGVSDQTSSSTATYGTISNTYIGQRSDNGAGYWNGQISNAQIFNRELSAIEINELMKNPTSITNGLVAHYPLTLNYHNGSDIGPNGYDLIAGSCQIPVEDSPNIFLLGGQ